MADHLTVSSETGAFPGNRCVRKEAGYVKELYVDYGTHVRKGQVMAVLEIPELEAQTPAGSGGHQSPHRRSDTREETR